MTPETNEENLQPTVQPTTASSKNETIKSEEEVDLINEYVDKRLDYILEEGKKAGTKFIYEHLIEKIKQSRRIFGKKMNEMAIHNLAEFISGIVTSYTQDSINIIMGGAKNLQREARNIIRDYQEKKRNWDIYMADQTAENDANKNNIENVYNNIQTLKIEVEKKNKELTDKLEHVDNLKLKSVRFETENELLHVQIKAQTDSIQGYKDQITKLMEKLADITEKAVTKQKEELTNNIKFNA